MLLVSTREMVRLVIDSPQRARHASEAVSMRAGCSMHIWYQTDQLHWITTQQLMKKPLTGRFQGADVSTRVSILATMAQNTRGWYLPTEYADVSPQVLDLIVQAPVLLLNGFIVGHDCLASQKLLLVVLTRDLQTHIVLFDSLKLVDDEIVLLAFLLNLQRHFICGTCSCIIQEPGLEAHGLALQSCRISTAEQPIR